MGLESTTTIAGLVSTNPTATDPKSEGDDHIRLIKTVLKTTFPNVDGVISSTDEELSGLAIANLGDVAASIVPGTLWSLSANSHLRKVTKDYASLDLVAISSGAAAATIATIQAGYRPAATVHAPAMFLDSSSGFYYSGYIQIGTLGTVVFFTDMPAVDVNDIIIANVMYKLA